MNGGTKVTTIGDHTIILRELVDNDKRGGKQSNSIENKWIKLSNRNGGEILISVELELPKAGEVQVHCIVQKEKVVRRNVLNQKRLIFVVIIHPMQKV